ncbi:uncharacterized protein LOC123685686 isoform X5 [Harmonia axyridis]|uniref:uncharacterized protein LOC123685686 isoform X5 n=1 Tax=Harmonia axyridis TaxID=115357 RepID=UPI001E275FFD|nr:uncharacterized protein LOC123685686 isoform X5 [Harmonia axyridis]
MCGVGAFLGLLALLGAATRVRSSEFPERECCDLPPPGSPTTPSPTVPPGPVGTSLRPGSSVKTTTATLNCLLARQFCFEDASCSAILEIIPRVCGPELVACSTVTVTKCQAALRTLQAFPFFKPTCLCRPPQVDPECNTFRDFLFDHPCVFVTKKEKDPYPVDALPTCNHALSVCQQERKCIKLYEDFKTNCKVRDNKCRMEDRDSCHEAWANLRRSPMFGCICPNNHMKKRCDRIFSMVNHNPCVGSSDIGRSENDVSKMIFQSTCHVAMDSCNNNYHCRMSLSPILHHCDISRCNRNSCMEALQAFYRKPSLPWNMEIAFCLCKKTNNKQDACLVAQEKLHPVCAQRVVGAPQPTCLSLAEVCRDNKECRSRLEQYEQSCAVDSVTKKCAGSPSDCRSAMLGILGTDLRTTCACKGTDMTQIYECLGWQRLLWVNPCVVESQKDFHMLKAAELAKYTTTQAPTRIIPPRIVTTKSPMPIFVTVMSATEASLHTRENTMPELIPPPQPFIPTSTTTTTTTTTTHRPTTTTMKTTTIPPRYCVVQRPQFPDQYIKEGSFKRIYHEDEFECSDICECEVGEKLSCKTICIDRMPCKTEFAFYNHAAPAYQAFRGRCLCYSGRFICIKPSPGDYNLPQGVFLFLGYSEADEKELNKNQTRVSVQDIVRILQTFIKEEAVNGTLCSLELFNITRENVIIIGKLSEEVDYNTLSPTESFHKEKEECTELMEIISDRINSRNPDFISHLLLSIFKMAEVEIIQIEHSSNAIRFNSKFNVVVAMAMLTTIFRLHSLTS